MSERHGHVEGLSTAYLALATNLLAAGALDAGPLVKSLRLAGLAANHPESAEILRALADGIELVLNTPTAPLGPRAV